MLCSSDVKFEKIFQNTASVRVVARRDSVFAEIYQKLKVIGSHVTFDVTV